jgi:hypothetical protein
MLVDYLKYLDKNKTAYNSYFQWEEHVSFRELKPIQRFAPLCYMCIKLQLESYEGFKESIVEDAGSHWGRKENCKIHRIFSKNKVKVFELVNL